MTIDFCFYGIVMWQGYSRLKPPFQRNIYMFSNGLAKIVVDDVASDEGYMSRRRLTPRTHEHLQDLKS